MKVLDLFAGIGGFSLGLEMAGMQTIAFCEIEQFCQKVLKKHWHNVPIAKDIKKMSHREGILYDDDKPIYQGNIDLICGGFPCQPFSVAGKKKGFNDDRDLWPEMFRLISDIKPNWVIGENVAHFVKMGFERTASQLEGEGYAVQAFIIPACGVNAPHRRDRVWIIAHSESMRHCGRKQRQISQIREWDIFKGLSEDGDTVRGKATSSSQLCSTVTDFDNCGFTAGSNHRRERPVLYDSNGHASQNQRKREGWECGAGTAGNSASNDDKKRVQGQFQKTLFRERAFSCFKNVRSVEDYFRLPDIPKPLICRSDDGFSSRLDRLKALGNSVVPQIPQIIGEYILKIEKDLKSCL